MPVYQTLLPFFPLQFSDGAWPGGSGDETNQGLGPAVCTHCLQRTLLHHKLETGSVYVVVEHWTAIKCHGYIPQYKEIIIGFLTKMLCLLLPCMPKA